MGYIKEPSSIQYTVLQKQGACQFESRFQGDQERTLKVLR